MVDKILSHKIIKNQVVRFIFSAGAGFLVDQLAFNLFFHYLFRNKTYQIHGFTISNYAISFSISYFMGVVVNFLITRYVVFSDSKLAPYKQFVRFVSVAILGYFANLLVIELLIKGLGVYPTYARPLAALSLFFASFFVHKLFSFSLSLRHHAVQSPNE
jgi:putative flippase GtrA